MFKHFITPMGVEVMLYVSKPYSDDTGKDAVTSVRWERSHPASTVSNIQVFTHGKLPNVVQGAFGEWIVRNPQDTRLTASSDLWGTPEIERVLEYLPTVPGITDEDFNKLRLFLLSFKRRVDIRMRKAVEYGVDGIVQAELSLQHRILTTIGIVADEVKNPSGYEPIIATVPIESTFHVPERETKKRVDAEGMEVTSLRALGGACLFYANLRGLPESKFYGGSRAAYKAARGYLGVYIPDAKYKPNAGAYKGALVFGEEMDNLTVWDGTRMPSFFSCLLSQLQAAGHLNRFDWGEWEKLLEAKDIITYEPTVVLD